jgi:hypothetical protein
MMRHQAVAVCACLVAVLGCGAEMKSDFTTGPAVKTQSAYPQAAAEASSTAGSTDQETPRSRSATERDVSKRKIVYRADIDLVVEQFDPLPEQIEAAVRQHGGFVSASNITGSPGQPRNGRWTVRVPVDRFAEFVAAVRQLGEVRSINSTSDDVTAEYYDIEARIRNKQQEEERLLKLLAEATGKLEEILAVERELSRVRGEIEQAQGRLRMLKDVTDLTTVTVSVTEIKNYVPEEAPTYLTRVRRAFSASTMTLVSAAQGLSLVAVALVPWLPVPLVLVLIVLAIRRLRRRS